jgi:benzoyl-CoA reductase/2-hydroxyglutaryl-CoA dehydratase subunit BcrC/BadD/HgdB
VNGGSPARNAHGPLIGVIGADVPRQVVLACGGTPVRLFGSWGAPLSPEASDLLGAVDPVATRLLQSLLAGEHDDLAALVICNDSTANLRLFYVVRILAQRGRLCVPVHLLDAPRGAGPVRQRFVAGQYARLARFTASVTGRVLDDASLKHAARRELALGQALDRLRYRRRTGRCSGVEALSAYRAAAQMPPEDAAAVVDAARSTSRDRSTRLFVTGSCHPDESVHATLESTGMVVVGENCSTGDASWLGEAVEAEDAESALMRLAAVHAARPPLSPRSLTQDQVHDLLHRVEETDADCVVALVREFDDAPLWDLSGYRDALRRRGVPLVSDVRVASEGTDQAAQAVLGDLTRLGREENR